MPSFSDDFSGTNGALLRQRSGWSFSGSATYQDRATISTNRAKLGGSAGLTLHYAYVRDVGEAAQFVEARVLRAAGLCPGLYARWVDSNNFIQVRGNGTAVELIKRVGGTITSVATLASSLAANDVIRLQVSGSTAKLFRNGAVLGAAGGYTISDAALASATKVGFGGEGSAGSAETFDDIAGGGLSVALVPTDGRSVGRADAGGAAVRFGLAAQDGRSAGRSDSGAVALRIGLAGADARSAGRGDAAAVLFHARAVLAVAGGRLSVRADAAALGLRIGVAAQSARLAGRGGVAGLSWRGILAAADGRSGVRGVAALRPPFGPPGIGEICTVPGEGAAAVWAEGREVRVAAEPPRVA